MFLSVGMTRWTSLLRRDDWLDTFQNPHRSILKCVFATISTIARGSLDFGEVIGGAGLRWPRSSAVLRMCSLGGSAS